MLPIQVICQERQNTFWSPLSPPTLAKAGLEWPTSTSRLIRIPWQFQVLWKSHSYPSSVSLPTYLSDLPDIKERTPSKHDTHADSNWGQRRQSWANTIQHTSTLPGFCMRSSCLILMTIHSFWMTATLHLLQTWWSKRWNRHPRKLWKPGMAGIRAKLTFAHSPKVLPLFEEVHRLFRRECVWIVRSSSLNNSCRWTNDRIPLWLQSPRLPPWEPCSEPFAKKGPSFLPQKMTSNVGVRFSKVTFHLIFNHPYFVCGNRGVRLVLG